VKEWEYRNCFNTEYNLSLKLPKKDTCKACDIAKVAIDAQKDKNEQEKLRKSMSYTSERLNLHVNS